VSNQNIKVTSKKWLIRFQVRRNITNKLSSLRSTQSPVKCLNNNNLQYEQLNSIKKRLLIRCNLQKLPVFTSHLQECKEGLLKLRLQRCMKLMRKTIQRIPCHWAPVYNLCLTMNTRISPIPPWLSCSDCKKKDNSVEFTILLFFKYWEFEHEG
jgi:hypothetical protein